MKKTSINIPDEIINSVRDYNKKNPDDQINISAECRKALRAKLIQVGVTVPGQ